MRLGLVVAFYREYAAIITNVSILLFEKMVTIGLVFFCEGVISHLLGVSYMGNGYIRSMPSFYCHQLH